MRQSEIATLPSKFTSFDEAANYLGIKKSTLYALSGVQIAYYQVGRRRWFTIADLDEWIESTRQEIYGVKRKRRKPKATRRQ